MIICEEFSLSNFQLQMGRPEGRGVARVGRRTGVDDLRSLAAILIQADKFGSSVAQALRVQSDSMRTRRRQLAEEKAAKTAVKLIFPLVIFIFPGDLRGARRPGRDHDDPRDVPGDERALVASVQPLRSSRAGKITQVAQAICIGCTAIVRPGARYRQRPPASFR